MNKEILKSHILLIYPIPDVKMNLILADYNCFTLNKNEFLLKENNISKQTYYLESGYIRSFIFGKEGQEVTTNIYSAPCFVNDFYSFFKQQPAKENYQTLSPCSGWTITYENVEKYFNAFPEYREFGRRLLVNNYYLLQEKMLGIIRETAEYRYLKLMEEHPKIFQNVSLKIIASYLGITDTSLSRIRKEIHSK
jgi:CRP-like cAMP-binding protein